MELKRRRRAPARSLLSGSREAAGSRSRRSPTGRRGRVLPRVKASAQRTIVRWGCRRGSSGRAVLRLVAGTAGSTGRGSLQTAVYKRRVAFTNVAVYKRRVAVYKQRVAVYKRRVVVYKRRVAVYKRGSFQECELIRGDTVPVGDSETLSSDTKHCRVDTKHTVLRGTGDL